jgi:hypothetical protein
MRDARLTLSRSLDDGTHAGEHFFSDDISDSLIAWPQHELIAERRQQEFQRPRPEQLDLFEVDNLTSYKPLEQTKFDVAIRTELVRCDDAQWLVDRRRNHLCESSPVGDAHVSRSEMD